MPVDRRTPVFYGLIFNQLLFIVLLVTDLSLGLRTDYTFGLPVSYPLVIGYMLVSGFAPALLTAFYVEHLLDAGDRERRLRVLIEHTIGLSVLFGSAVVVTYFWFTTQTLEFFPLTGLVVYCLASGILWLSHIVLLFLAVTTTKVAQERH